MRNKKKSRPSGLPLSFLFKGRSNTNRNITTNQEEMKYVIFKPTYGCYSKG